MTTKEILLSLDKVSLERVIDRENFDLTVKKGKNLSSFQVLCFRAKSFICNLHFLTLSVLFRRLDMNVKQLLQDFGLQMEIEMLMNNAGGPRF